ncbi:hypothetical protein BO221_31665 [Archangium sp. Cb G35]|nr:hypothetical protein BO221_31665 [Archangium sp. Cb G35]
MQRDSESRRQIAEEVHHDLARIIRAAVESDDIFPPRRIDTNDSISAVNVVFAQSETYALPSPLHVRFRVEVTDVPSKVVRIAANAFISRSGEPSADSANTVPIFEGAYGAGAVLDAKIADYLTLALDASQQDPAIHTDLAFWVNVPQGK